MKINSKFLDFSKNIVITVIIFMGCFILIDLYVPIKRMLMGDDLNMSEILSYIELKEHIPIVIAVSFGLEVGRSRKKNK